MLRWTGGSPCPVVSCASCESHRKALDGGRVHRSQAPFPTYTGAHIGIGKTEHVATPLPSKTALIASPLLTGRQFQWPCTVAMPPKGCHSQFTRSETQKLSWQGRPPERGGVDWLCQEATRQLPDEGLHDALALDLHAPGGQPGGVVVRNACC